MGFSLGTASVVVTHSDAPPPAPVVPEVINWSGSGFFINNSGYLVTASHVYSEHGKDGKVLFTAKELLVHFQGQTYPATVVGIDYTHDVAILHINAKGTPFFPLDLRPRLNDKIVELGYPLPYTTGFNLKWKIVKVADEGYRMPGYMMTTGLSCAGNSGGPLVTQKTGVLGVLVMGTNELNDGNCGNTGIESLSVWVAQLAQNSNVDFQLVNDRHPKASLPQIYEISREDNSVVEISGHN